MAVLSALVSIPLIVVAALAGVAKLRGADNVSTEMHRLGLSESRAFRVGIVDIAGAIGLAVGVFIPAVGVVAALAWVAYWVTALVLHARAGDPIDRLGGPLLFTLVSVIVLGLHLLQIS